MKPSRSPANVNALPGNTAWIDGGSHKPLWLTSAEQVWIVRRGHFDVFGTTTGASGGRRTHLFRIEAGEALFGVEPSDDAFGLVAVGSLDSAVESLDPDAPVESSRTISWIAGLCHAASEPLSAWPDAIVAPGHLSLTNGQCLAADPAELRWVEVLAGAVHFLNLARIEVGSPLPMAGRAWIVADGDVSALASVTTHVQPRALSRINRIVLHGVRDHVRRREESQSRVAAISQGMASQEFDSALANLAGAAATRLRRFHGARRDDELGAAVDELLRAMRVPQDRLTAAREAIAANSDRESTDDRLDFVLSRLRMGRRHVILNPDFRRFQGSPLLGWEGEDRKPVAIVYQERRGWEIRDAAGARALDERRLSDLARDALQLYPTLPAGPIRFRDLFGFGGAGSTPDLVRLGLGLAALTLLGMTSPIWAHYLMDSVIPDGRLNVLGLVIAALALTSIGTMAFELFKALALQRTRGRFESRLQPALIDRLIRLPTTFYRGYTVGDIADRALGIQTARETVSGTVVGAVLGGVTGLLGLAPLFYFSPPLALLVLAFTLVICVAVAGLAYGELRHERERLRHQGELEGFVMQMLVGIPKLRAAAAESRAMARWARHFIAQRDRFVSAQWWSAALQTAMSVLPILATVTLYAVIGHTLQGGVSTGLAITDANPGGRFSAADFVAFSTAFGLVMGSLTGTAYALTKMLVVAPLIERARPILETPVEVTQGAEAPGTLTGAVELRRVKFRYIADGPTVIDDVSLRIEPGEFVAFVGPSGSGKSTIARLILGFERPEEGDVFFDARSASSLDMPAVRRQIGVVLQQGRLSSGSIFENIGGDAGVGIDDAWAAARLVGLDQDIENMPMGMHTVLLDGGATLSGGQRQRILIARALIHRPRFLILDEATSALDNRTQAIVTETLAKLAITRIVIAHRLSSIQAADRVFVFDRGRLVETGTHDALMMADGAFAALAKRQLL
jgi:NHLM bacteriocin system ABC transporter ATP-binding protein